MQSDAFSKIGAVSGRRNQASFALLILCALFLVTPPGAPAHAAQAKAGQARASAAEAVRVAIKERLSAGGGAMNEASKAEQAALVNYYSASGNRPLWVDGKGLTVRAKAVMAEMAKADDYGLRAQNYALPTLGDGSLENGQLAEAEITLSLAVMRYARDARGGRIEPARLSANLAPALALPKPLEVIESIAIRFDPAAYLRSFQPAQPQFEALRRALVAARGGNSDPNFVRIPDGPVLELGMKHEQVALLRRRLRVPSQASADETLFDASIDDAVKRFKAAYGAVPDGIVGPETRRALNQPRQQAANPERVRLILANMERWRWLPNDLGSFYLMVNVPEFALRVVEDGKSVQAARVVVGKPDTQTPIVSSEINEVVFNPSWTVPDLVKTGELLPHILEDAASVLQANNLHVSSGGREIDPTAVDWSSVDIRSLDIRQPPGPDNVLGGVKFALADRQDLYLHDTPYKTMFAEANRADSFGSVRVQNADKLALLLLRQDQSWTAARVTAAMQTGYDQHVALKQAVPVYISYFTVWANDDGSLSTFADVYGHDSRVAAALAGTNVVADRASSRTERVASGELQAPLAPKDGDAGSPVTQSLSDFLGN